jgi:hypothetical protein
LILKKAMRGVSAFSVDCRRFSGFVWGSKMICC